MSLEDDILRTVQDLIRRAKEVVAYAGVVSDINTTTKVVSVIVDGANAGIPCVPVNDIDLSLGQRVVILKAANNFYVIAITGLKTVVRLPRYTTTHPTGTSTGDMWYRDDLNNGYININGTPTALT